MSIMDRKSIKAYFGSQAGQSTRKMQRISKYPSGTISYKAIELTQDVQTKKGYLELLGLVNLEKRGRVWFLVVKDSSVVPELGLSGVHTGESVCLGSGQSNDNFSLSPSTTIVVMEGWEENPTKHKAEEHREDCPEQNRDRETVERSYIHTLQGEREKSVELKLTSTGSATAQNGGESARIQLCEEAKRLLTFTVPSEPDNGKVQWSNGEAKSGLVSDISALTEEDEATKLIRQELPAGKGRTQEELAKILLDKGITQQQVDLTFTQLTQAGKITIDDVGTVFWKET